MSGHSKSKSFEHSRSRTLAGFAYINVDTDGLTEDGGASALQGAGRSNAMTYATLGARGAVPVTVAKLPVTLSATLKWQHAFGDNTPDGLFAFKALPDQTFRTAGLSYDGELASGAHSNGLHANLAIRF
jgi:uncharacterized protein with beta-barrel porin domain